MTSDVLASIPTKVAQAAALLIGARRGGQRLGDLPEQLRPADLDAAYAIQAAGARLRGLPIAGYKIGLTNERAQRSMRTTEPIVGRLAATDIRLAPARIPVQWPRYVEAEVIFKMGEDLPARNAPYTAKQVAGSLCAAFAGIEVCTSRFVPDDVPLAHLVADNSNAELLIVGESFPMEGVAQLADLPVTLARRGEPLVHGSTTHVLGQPLFSVTWLANWLAARGEGLERGQWVATGSCTGIVEATTDDLVVARLGTSAQAIVEFFPQSIHGEGES